MIKAKQQKRQQGCDLAKLIETIETAISAAVTIYKAAEPIITAMLKNWRKSTSSKSE
jgi:hypothetical protein